MKKIGYLILVFSFNLPVFAQQVAQPKAGAAGSWRLIGTVDARFTADHDGIVVKGPFDDFRRVKLKVTDAPLRLVKMVVTYENGAPDNIEVLDNIPKGGESRIIDLRGRSRRIRRIDFWYDTRGVVRGHARLTVFGMK